MKVDLWQADALEWLQSLADASVDSIVTDPPAGIGFMGKEWDTFGKTRGMSPETISAQKAAEARNEPFGRSGVAAKAAPGAREAFVGAMTTIFTEAFRVLKPGAHGLVWALPRTSHWMAWALEDAGFEVRDIVMHIFGTGFPKSRNVSKDFAKQGDAANATRFAGYGTALKPACEHWILIRKPIRGPIYKNVAEHGTGALNIDGCRVAHNEDLTSTGDNTPMRAGSGWGFKRTARGNEGRWPAHLALDPEAAAMLDEQSGVRKSGSMRAGTTRRNRSGYAGPLPAATGAATVSSEGGASRFFYVAKPSRAEREAGLEAFPLKSAKKFNEGGIQGRRDAAAEAAIADASVESQGLDAKGRTLIREDGTKTLVDRFIPQHRANNHPTIKAVALMRWLVRLITPPGGLVIDPFLGSGSTGVAAAHEGFDFAGCDMSEEYVHIAAARIAHAQSEQRAASGSSEAARCSLPAQKEARRGSED
jgi:site-specific DNA-methyltransferase (adenine-specific)